MTVVHVEMPAVISALQVFSIETAAVERHAPVRAGIAQSEWFSHSITSNHQRDLQQSCLMQQIAVHSICWESAIPEAGEHERIGRLSLWKVKFRHGEIVDCGLLIVETRGLTQKAISTQSMGDP